MKLSELKPDKRNARRHNERNIGMIADSLREVGAARSIVIDEDGNILAGNGTVQAAKDAGLTKLQVVEVDGDTLVAVKRSGLTQEQKTRLAIADNRTAELAEWDESVLKNLVAEEFDFDGLFTDAELEELLAKVNAPNFEPATAEEQGQLDEKSKCKCPNCGHEFAP